MGETEPETNNAHLRSCGIAGCLESGRSWAGLGEAVEVCQAWGRGEGEGAEYQVTGTQPLGHPGMELSLSDSQAGSPFKISFKESDPRPKTCQETSVKT